MNQQMQKLTKWLLARYPESFFTSTEQ